MCVFGAEFTAVVAGGRGVRYIRCLRRSSSSSHWLLVLRVRVAGWERSVEGLLNGLPAYLGRLVTPGRGRGSVRLLLLRLGVLARGFVFLLFAEEEECEDCERGEDHDSADYAAYYCPHVALLLLVGADAGAGC